MKKTLLAAALTVGFAGVAQAETSVTLYGIIDTGVGYERIKSDDVKLTKTGLRNGVQSGNRWGLKGVEDLGNGMRAVFQLESGFDSSTGFQVQRSGDRDRLFGRQATLGLASDSWGQLDFGRQTNIASKYLPGIVDPFGGGFGQANVGTSFAAADTLRYDNMIMYQTPNFSGFQFGVGYSFNTSGEQLYRIKGVDGLDDSDPNSRAVTTGLRYANGPLGVALTYDQVKNSNVGYSGESSSTSKQWNLGVGYDFEIVKVSAAFGQTRHGAFAPFYGVSANDTRVGLPSGITLDQFDGYKANQYMVGLSAPIGAGTILASWQVSDPRNNPDQGPLANVDLEKQQIYSLGYTYGLSKRTNVYAYGTYAKNRGHLDGVKTTVGGVGLRHQF